jgi:hypothetical protein
MNASNGRTRRSSQAGLAHDQRRRAVLLSTVAVLASSCQGAAPAGDSTSNVTIPGVVSYPGLSHRHIAAPVAYPQLPPVGGRHWPPRAGGVLGWQACSVYGEPVVNEFAVHSLEHGAVWLTYRPGATPADVSRLYALAAIRPAYVLVSPFPGQPKPFTATAWGLQLETDTADDRRLALFTRAYAGGPQGGEPGADCVGGSTLLQARAALRALR